MRAGAPAAAAIDAPNIQAVTMISDVRQRLVGLCVLTRHKVPHPKDRGADRVQVRSDRAASSTGHTSQAPRIRPEPYSLGTQVATEAGLVAGMVVGNVYHHGTVRLQV